jgi:hypothetical protein
MSENSCDRCGKECKDKRGLALHLKKCEGLKALDCEYCNQVFANPYSLSVHLTRCKAIKIHKETMNKEEIISLQSELQSSKAEISKLLSLQKESKNEIDKILNIKEEENQRLKEKLQELELKHQKEQSELTISLKLDLERQLKLRDVDSTSFNNEIKTLKEKVYLFEKENTRLTEDLNELKVEKRELLTLYSKERQKDTNTTIINQNDNRVQLQCLESSMIQGRINPPSYVIGDVPALVNMLRSLGIRNSYRINDKARGTLTWNKPEEGEVRDPTGEKLMNHIIDSLNIDLIKERSYYEEEEKKLCDTEDPDLYLLQEARMFITFCNQLLKKDPAILKLFKKELVKQGKVKGDTEEDQVYETTYTKFITAITISLFPNVYAWIELSFYELGRYIGSRIRNHYHTEGASREFLYIVIHNDDNYNKQVYSKKLIPFIKEAVSDIIDDGSIESLLRSLVLGNPSINVSKAEKMIDYLKNPTAEDTLEVMRGIVSL